ncbi:hypothetical protein EGW08_009915 [Elysia chlorotica]|uniref:CUB domain-containing protein n=1 Tax=Elysia chlorotica TaxID=188477 RepID=A0A433TLC1_ELYCH|nr:hypothetical protein EGW08_009915 [Elysia chlorotica]
MEFRYQSDMVRVAFLVIKLCLIMCCSGCNVKLRGDSGALESPKHPDHHGSQVRCEWSISTSPGTKVRLTFTDLELKDVNGCNVDYIQIRNGNNKDAPLLAKLCGEKKSLPPGPITASGNNMFIEFSTDRRTPLGGFQAVWAAGNNTDNYWLFVLLFSVRDQHYIINPGVCLS